jgi:hypothetical protein
VKKGFCDKAMRCERSEEKELDRDQHEERLEAIVCWLARRDVHTPGSQGVVVALLFYNLAVAGVLLFASFGHDLHGILLWPAVTFHTAMAAWCVATLLRSEEKILG